MSRRKRFYDYYTRPLNERRTDNSIQLVEKAAAAAAAGDYAFKGEKVELSIVVRADLNNYTKLTKDKSIADRVALLDDFFSKSINSLGLNRGIYFRDEGDCIVAIFSSYFNDTNLVSDVNNYCMSIVKNTYGRDALTAKCCVSFGNVAYFQKAHEKGTVDWSAEGDPFVATARLESVVESKPRIYFYKNQFKHFNDDVPSVSPGGYYYWTTNKESMQVPGMGFTGGWTEVAYLEHVGKTLSRSY